MLDYKVTKVQKIANEILTAAISGFTIKKPLKLSPEGATRYSLSNANLIHDAGYLLVNATFEFDKKRGNYALKCTFERDGETIPYVFKGFALGYGGEGPRGFKDAMILWDIDVSDIAFGDKFTPESGSIKIK